MVAHHSTSGTAVSRPLMSLAASAVFQSRGMVSAGSAQMRGSSTRSPEMLPMVPNTSHSDMAICQLAKVAWSKRRAMWLAIQRPMNICSTRSAASMTKV